MQSLNDTNKIDQVDPERHGAIQIQRIVDNEQERFVVYIPGTDDLSPIPQDGEHARDMEANYQLIGGMDSAYGQGIQQAMLDAGLEGKDVMLVGHSQGGMVSTLLAADPDSARHFNVQHVVTAGSPTAQVPDLPAGRTVKFNEGTSDIGGNHDIDHYVHGAAAADASTNGSIQDQIRHMQEDGYLGGGTVTEVQTFQITRR